MTSRNQPLDLALLFLALLAFAVAPAWLPPSYSWVEHGISEAAGQGVEGAWITRTGFLAFGLAVLRIARLRRVDWQPLATFLHRVFGLSMLAVAAFSARSWEPEAPYVASEDLLHSAFATAMGFAYVTALVSLVVVRRHRSSAAALPDWLALVVTALVPPLGMSTAVWGLMQRVMFAVAGAWYAKEVWTGSRTGLGVQIDDPRQR